MRVYSRNLSKLLLAFGLVVLLIGASGCQVVEDGTSGISKSFGKIEDKPLGPGLYWVLPIVREIEVWNIKATRLPWTISVPSVDGMMVNVESTVIYHPTDVIKLRKEIGAGYQQQLVVPSVSDTIREKIGKLQLEYIIQNQDKLNADVLNGLRDSLTPRGIAIDAHMFTGLQLPAQFQEAVARKLEQKQKIQQREYELEQVRKEAEMEITRAEGSAKAQEIVNRTLSPNYLQFLWITNLSKNPNVVYVPTESGMALFKAMSDRPQMSGGNLTQSQSSSSSAPSELKKAGSGER